MTAILKIRAFLAESSTGSAGRHDPALPKND